MKAFTERRLRSAIYEYDWIPLRRHHFNEEGTVRVSNYLHILKWKAIIRDILELIAFVTLPVLFEIAYFNQNHEMASMTPKMEGGSTCSLEVVQSLLNNCHQI